MKVKTLKNGIAIYAVVSIIAATSLIFLSKRDSLFTEAYNVAVEKIATQSEGEVPYNTGYITALILRVEEYESLVLLLLVLQLVTASLLLFLIFNTKTVEEKSVDVT
jgi:hypothetical protein